MIYIFGLGNPGEEYARSKHNAGFRVVDELAKKLQLSAWNEKKELCSHIARSQSVTLVKPQTYMNDSGDAVSKVLHYYAKELLSKEEPLEAVYIVYDDLDLTLGVHKIQFGTHPKVHNGLNSILETIKREDFWNVRIGIDTRNGDRTHDSKSFVLHPFSLEEERILAGVITNVVQVLYGKVIPPQPSI